MNLPPNRSKGPLRKIRKITPTANVSFNSDRVYRLDLECGHVVYRMKALDHLKAGRGRFAKCPECSQEEAGIKPTHSA